MSKSDAGSTNRHVGSRGTEVLQQNISDGVQVGDFVGTTLGPHGRDKLLFDQDEEFEHYFEVSNSASFILKRVSFEAPAAKVIANVAAAQEDRFGDGTATTAVYASEILRAVKPLLDQGLHPRTAIQGVQEAIEIAADVIESQTRPVTPDDRGLLEDVAATALAGSNAGSLAPNLQSPIVNAALNVARISTGEVIGFNADLVQTEAIRSRSLQDTEVIDGMVLKKSYAGNVQPTRIEDPRIALLTQGFARQRAIEERLGGDPSDESSGVAFAPTSAADLQRLRETELTLVADQLEPLVNADINVVFVEDRVEDALLPYFDQAGIAVVRNVRIDRMRTVAAATGAAINTHLREFSAADAGHAQTMIQRSIGGQDVLTLKDGAQRNAAALLAYGSTWAAGWEAERNVENAVRAVGATLRHDGLVPGGGAIEIEIARRLRKQAPAVGGRESLVVEAVADAVEKVPVHLARTAGMRPTDTLSRLRAAHAQGDTAIGICGFDRRVGDVDAAGIRDVARTKENGLRVAGGAATTVLRIDDIVTGVDA